MNQVDLRLGGNRLRVQGCQVLAGRGQSPVCESAEIWKAETISFPAPGKGAAVLRLTRADRRNSRV
jgi:hypothetical protein